MGKSAGGVSLNFCGAIRRSVDWSLQMKNEFNHAANDSPRSGSSKQVTPVVWFAMVATVVVIVIWFAIKP